MNTERLELAKFLASRINMAKNLGADAKGATQQAAEAILKGGASQPIITVCIGSFIIIIRLQIMFLKNMNQSGEIIKFMYTCHVCVYILCGCCVF